MIKIDKNLKVLTDLTHKAHRQDLTRRTIITVIIEDRVRARTATVTITVKMIISQIVNCHRRTMHAMTNGQIQIHPMQDEIRNPNCTKPRHWPETQCHRKPDKRHSR